MSYQGSTSNNHEITEEEEDNISQGQRSVLQAQQHQYQSSNPDTVVTQKETDDHVTLFVAYDGEWEYDNNECFFKNSKGSTMDVTRRITLSEITDKLYKQFALNKELYHLKLEVHYKTTGSPWFPVTEIQLNKDLSVFISKASKTILPLCVSRSLVWDAQAILVDGERREDGVIVFVAYDGYWRRVGKESVFKDSESSTIFVPKHITLPEINDILYKHLGVNKKLYRFKLEVKQYGTEYPTEIEENQDLSVLIKENFESRLPLYVTRIYDDEISSDVAGARRKGTVTIFVTYKGKWEYKGEELFFKNSKQGIMLDVPKHIKMTEITDILNEKLHVNTKFYRLKLEVHYRTGSPWFPIIEIQNDRDLSQFIVETSKTKVPLCVTRLRQDYAPDVDEEWRKDDDTIENRLLKAIRQNDWVKAREIVNTKEVTWTSKLDEFGKTAIHFAVGECKDNEVVKDIVNALKSNRVLLETTVTNRGETPAHEAAFFGNTEALKIMLNLNPKCLFTPDHYNELPICNALAFPAIKTFQYIYNQMKICKDDFDTFLRSGSCGELSDEVIDAGLIDVAYMWINYHRDRATIVDYDDITLVERIIRKPDLFYSGTDYNSYQRFVYRHVPIENNSLGGSDMADIEKNSTGGSDTADVENQETPKKDTVVTKHTRMCLQDVIWRIWVKLWKTTLLHVPHVKHLKEDKVKHNTTIKLLNLVCAEIEKTNTSSEIKRLYSSPFCLAVENNTDEAIDVLTTYFPQLYASQKDEHSIYELTVLNRSEKVYSYILHHDCHAKPNFSVPIDDDGNNVLHLAGRLAPVHKLNAASGAALQMQQELQWFEEVKRVVGIAHTRALNKNKETPIMVYRKEHKELRKDGEEWMKKTADSYTITAALIITIVFAAAITVPGGNDSDTGKPIYEAKASLIIFAISDAISLFTSTTSLLLSLSILTARYADEDFLYKLPKRLIFGLVMLFVSVTSMMIAFSAALYIMFGQEKQWILIPIGALACLPISSFVTLQFPLLVELISSTYGPGIFAKEKYYWQSRVNANKMKSA